MTASHKSMMPCLFEAIVVFLLENKDWWDIDLVQSMLAGHWKDKLEDYDYSGANDDYEGSEW